MTSIKSDGRIEFRFYRPGASDVKLVGSFNNWDESHTSLQHLGGGWWLAEAEIEPGEHYFRYVADGHWYTDFAANGVERNKHGWNSILVVPERRLRIGMPITTNDTAIGTGRQDEAVAA